MVIPGDFLLKKSSSTDHTVTLYRTGHNCSPAHFTKFGIIISENLLALTLQCEKFDLSIEFRHLRNIWKVYKPSSVHVAPVSIQEMVTNPPLSSVAAIDIYTNI